MGKLKFMSERALISVTNKDGLEEFAAALHKRGIEIVASGGTHPDFHPNSPTIATYRDIPTSANNPALHTNFRSRLIRN